MPPAPPAAPEPPPGALVPPEPRPDLAERVSGWGRAWVGRHRKLVRYAIIAYVLWLCVGVTVLAAELVVVPSTQRGIVVVLGTLWLLVQLAVVARTRTLSLSGVGRFLSLGATLAVPIGLLEVAIGDAFGQDPSSGPASVFIAGPVEETLKLTPLLLALIVAPHRVRRMGATDFLLAATAAGAGFQLVEDMVRRIASGPSIWSGLGPISGDTQYGFLLPGWSLNGDIEFAGHGVLTGLIGAGIGLAIRARRRWWWLLPVVLLGWSVLDHMDYNDGGDGQLPGAITTLHAVLGTGGAARPLLVVLLIATVVSDAYAIWSVRTLVPPLPGPGAWAGASPTTGVPPAAAALIDRARALGLHVASEFALLGRSMPRGVGAVIVALRLIRTHRELAMSVARASGRPRRDAPSWQETWQRSAGLHAMLTGAVAAAITLVIAVPYASGARHPAFLASLFDALASWWDGLGPTGQALTVLGLVALLTFMSFALVPEIALGAAFFDALGYTLGASSLFESGHEIASAIRNPKKVWEYYQQHPDAAYETAGLIVFSRFLPPGTRVELERLVKRPWNEARWAEQLPYRPAGRWEQVPRGVYEKNTVKDAKKTLNQNYEQWIRTKNGGPALKEYKVGNRYFDGTATVTHNGRHVEAFLDAKGRYEQFTRVEPDGTLAWTKNGINVKKGLVEELTGQVNNAHGHPVVWHFMEERPAVLMRQAAMENNQLKPLLMRGLIRFEYTPMK